MTERISARRHYDNTLRRRRADETHERIVTAGCELLDGTSIRDWRGLTIRGVAERAGVNERTVFRHFTNERGLRDAVMQRLEERAGIELASLRLEDIADVTGRIFESVAAHPLEPREPLDPTLSDASRRQHDALMRAVADVAGSWSEDERSIAAAMFDVLWGVMTYERLVVDWHLDHDQAVAGITWLIGLMEAAIQDGRSPACDEC